MPGHVHFDDLTELTEKSHTAIGIQLEIILQSLGQKLDHAITERADVTRNVNALVQEIAVIDGETATRTAEIAERTANLADIGAVIAQVQEKACALALETKEVKGQVQEKLKEVKSTLMDGKNRLERVRGALLDLYSEQLVLKASFLAYAGSLKGVTQKTRITREMNGQTHQMIRDMPPLKHAVQALRERITTFKTQTAEDSVRLHDKILAEREQRFTEAKEQKYLVQLYDEESQILDRLDADLKLHLDSALEVAGKLQQEVKEHETYFQHLQARLKQALRAERLAASNLFSSLLRGRKPATAAGTTTTTVQTVAPGPGIIQRLCPACGFVGRYCPRCSLKTLVPGAKKKPSEQETLIDLENRRAAMKAQLKYLEHKVQQLEIEVYISKMNVEVQMLQISIKIESWKKGGFVPASIQLSAVDTSVEAAPQMQPMLAAFVANARTSSVAAGVGGSGAFAKLVKKSRGKTAAMAGLAASLTAAHRMEPQRQPTLPTLQA